MKPAVSSRLGAEHSAVGAPNIWDFFLSTKEAGASGAFPVCALGTSRAYVVVPRRRTMAAGSPGLGTKNSDVYTWGFGFRRTRGKTIHRAFPCRALGRRRDRRKPPSSAQRVLRGMRGMRAGPGHADVVMCKQLECERKKLELVTEARGRSTWDLSPVAASPFWKGP